MVPAAVGFQCPSCIAEGKKTTRQGRTAYGGLRPSDASRTTTVIIAINVAVWLAVFVTGGGRLLDYLVIRARGLCGVGARGFDISHSACTSNGGTWLPGVSDGAYWQLITSVFTHQAVLHIGFNMFALWILGPQLELVIGRTRFIALYLLSGLAGSALVYWAAPEFQSTLGASGAIFGLLGALLVMAIKVGGDVRGLLVWIAINFAFTFAVANISWQGHVGGFVAGAVIGAILAYAPRGPRRTPVQVAGLSAVGVLIAVAIVARTLMLT